MIARDRPVKTLEFWGVLHLGAPLKMASPLSRFRPSSLVLAGAVTVLLGGCSFTQDALWPSLSGEDPKSQSTAPAQPAPTAQRPAPQGQVTRVDIPPSPAERAATASGQAQTAQGAVTASSTVVGQRVARMREDVQRLQAGVTGNTQSLSQLRAETVQTSARYYTLVGGINARLQVGTTPGNPILQSQWQEASQELDRISSDIGRMTTLSNQVSSDAALAAFLLESVRAAYGLSGAVEQDHRDLAVLEDEVNRTVVGIDRMLNELSEDVSRQSAYISRERSNLSTLALAIKNGELYGTGLGNRAFTAASAEPSAVARGAAQQQRGAASAAPSSDSRPLVVIRFDKSNPTYEQALYTAVNRALERKPDARFDIVAVAPSKGTQAQAALAASNSKKNAETVMRSLTNMGLPADRVKLTSKSSGSVQNSEVQVFVR
jgi:hypothetical protein